MPPRLRLVRPGEADDHPDEAPPPRGPDVPPPCLVEPPVPQDSPPRGEPVPQDSPPRGEPVPEDSPTADSLTLRLTLAPPPVVRVIASAAALAELDALLAGELDDRACARLAALAVDVPGRLRAITAALARTPRSASVVALRSLPPGAPGQLEALIRCLDHGVARVPPVPADSPAAPVPSTSPPVPADSLAAPVPSTSPPVSADSPAAPVPSTSLILALEFRSSRARGFPDLVARAQALAARGPAAEFAALDLDQRRHYRLTYLADRCPPAVLAAQLRAAHLDLAWLHARLLRLRGSRLWLGGWRFDVDDPLGPAAQGHLLQAWLRWAERGPTP